MRIRDAVVAGAFYPAEKEQVKSVVRQYISDAPLYKIPNIKAIVSPHAGYIYSGPVAGHSYRQLDNLDKSKHWTVFLVGPSHYAYFNGASVGLFDAYKTPLGIISVSKIARKLLSEEDFHFILEAHLEEHCLEVQLPFLQMALPHFEIVPIITGEVSPQYLGNTLSKYMTENSFIVISSDLSHYHPYNIAKDIDKHCSKAVEKLNLDEISLCEACGKVGITAAIYLSKKNKWKGRVLKYATSGNTAGPKAQVVGYGSYVFYKSENET